MKPVQTSQTEIAHLEELSMNAWPALQTILYDGWVLRFAEGYTRRANSVSPLYDQPGSLEERVRTCEDLYRGQDLPVVFKMTEASLPANLEAFLAARGYQAEARTSVQLLDLSGWPINAEGDRQSTSISLSDWLPIHSGMRGLDDRKTSIHGRMLSLLLVDACFAALVVDGEPAACGLGVAQNGYVGLFDIVTGESHRRKGYGERLVRSLLIWGKQRGASRAYLQVMLDNMPALRLYEKLGFEDAYQYWYRFSA